MHETVPVRAATSSGFGRQQIAVRSLPHTLQTLDQPGIHAVQTAAPERLPRLLPPQSAALRGAPLPPDVAVRLAAVEAGVGSCDSGPGAPLVVYVSKMVAVPACALPR